MWSPKHHGISNALCSFSMDNRGAMVGCFLETYEMRLYPKNTT